MRRRELLWQIGLRLTGLGLAGGAALPLLAACSEDAGAARSAPADQYPPGPPSLPDTPLGKHVAAADTVGKPTLVLAIPDDDLAKWRRGTLYGALLRTGDDGFFRELATVHVVCATAREVAEVAQFGGGADGASAFLIERGQDAYDATPVVAAITDEPDFFESVDDWDKADEIGNELVRKWPVPLRDAVVAAISADEALVQRRAARVRKSLGPDELARVTACLAGDALPDSALLARAAAVFRADDHFSHDDEDRWSASLAAAARETLLDERIAGSRWGTREGCGHSIDGVTQDYMVDCGMGFVPELGRRFLWLYTEDERGG